jgi:Tol biopolymer transport system component
MKQITNLGGANWAPSFTANGQKIIFSSNYKAKGFHFDLFLCNLDGTGLEQITYDPTFDAFPVFSSNGKKLMWCSMRNNSSVGHDMNVFIADWK